ASANTPEAFLCHQQGGRSPAQDHLCISPMLDTSRPCFCPGEATLDQIGGAEAASEIPLKPESVNSECLFQAPLKTSGGRRTDRLKPFHDGPEFLEGRLD